VHAVSRHTGSKAAGAPPVCPHPSPEMGEGRATTSPEYLPPRPSRVPDFRAAVDAADDAASSGSLPELHVHMVLDPRGANPQPQPHRASSPSATPMPTPPCPPPTVPDDPGTLAYSHPDPLGLPVFPLSHSPPPRPPASSVCSRYCDEIYSTYHFRPACPSRPALRSAPHRRATVKLAAALCGPSPAGCADPTAPRTDCIRACKLRGHALTPAAAGEGNSTSSVA
jgi:hypothetical protein